jgi:hypothetical protein
LFSQPFLSGSQLDSAPCDNNKQQSFNNQQLILKLIL